MVPMKNKKRTLNKMLCDRVTVAQMAARLLHDRMVVGSNLAVSYETLL